MKLFIARHGETDWNVAHRTCGWSESNLTEKGRAQAQALAARLAEEQSKNDIRRIFVSPLRRARDTASYIEKALNLTAAVDARIKEVNFGKFENLPWEKSDEFFRVRENPFVKFPAGESLVSASHRAYGLIDEIASAGGEGNVLFVCHGMIMALMSTYFQNITQEEFRNFHVDNCQLFEFDFEQG